MSNEHDAKFATLIDALSPALDQIIIVGGWACRLYRLCPGAIEPGYEPVFTTDTDVAVAAGSLKGLDLRARLKDSGFAEDFSGEDHPPLTHYTLGDNKGGFYAEFLTPLVGGESKRDGTPDVTVRVGNVIAQKLRYLDVLLIEPWSVELGPSNSFPLSAPAAVLIPNPVSYIVQKLLINNRRHPNHRAKDLLYIHDTIELFGGTLAELNDLWRSDVSNRLFDKQRQLVLSEADRLFGSVNDLIRDAALIASERVSPASLQAISALGLERILA